MISDTVALMMLISAFISISMLVIIISFFKNSYFEDEKKSFEYPLFDSVDDLRQAVKEDKKENKNKKLNDK